jgi:hypothetical protein
MMRAVNSGYALSASVSEVRRKEAHGGRQVVASVDFVKADNEV